MPEGDPVRGAALFHALSTNPILREQAEDEQARWDGYVLGGANYPSITVEQLRHRWGLDESRTAGRDPT